MARLADDVYTEGFKPARLIDFVDVDEFRTVGEATRYLRELITLDMNDEDLVQVMADNPKLAEIVDFFKTPNAISTSELRKNSEAFCRYIDDFPSDVELGRTIDRNRDGSTVLDPTFIESFWDAVVVTADDVYEYSRGLYEAGHRYETSDVGIQAPLFDRTFVEFRMPGNKLYDRGGVLIEVVDRDETIAELGPQLEPGSETLAAMRNCRWIMKYTPVAQKRKGDKISGPLMHTYVPVSAEGTFYPSPRDPKHSVLNVTAAGYYTSEGKRLEFEDCLNLEQVCAELFIAAYLTVSFAHCKNVKVSDRDPNKENEKLAKKQKRRTKGKGFVKFKTLEIPKMREMLDALKEYGKDGPKPFHIVRGHFKTYTEEKPLFGNIVGQYYWASQIRGILKDGATLKDYTVSPPPPQRGLERPNP